MDSIWLAHSQLDCCPGSGIRGLKAVSFAAAPANEAANKEQNLAHPLLACYTARLMNATGWQDAASPPCIAVDCFSAVAGTGLGFTGTTEKNLASMMGGWGDRTPA